MSEEKQQYSFEEVLNKLRTYCAYQERSLLEVRRKAFDIGAQKSQMESIIEELEAENFINEERFSRIYARSKFNSNHWGRFKIIEGLKSKGISNELIKEGLKELNDKTVQMKLKYLVSRRNIINDSKEKQIKFLLSKGFAMDEIMQLKF